MEKIWLTSLTLFLSLSISACQSPGHKRRTQIAPRPKTTHFIPKKEKEIQSNAEKSVPSRVVKTHSDQINTFNVYLDANVESSKDFQEALKEPVQKWVNYFTGKGRKWFQRALDRGAPLMPLIKQELTDAGLPVDLVYLAMIESGFNNRAYSRAHAAGTWQFIRSTGRQYGLKISPWIDERRDPTKATASAIKYLSDLYDIFGNWYLAAMAYNAGENKVSRAIIRYRTRTFHKLIKYSYLKSESRNYVPKLIAAGMIAKQAEKNGFTIPKVAPYSYATVTTKKPVSLKKLAKHLNIEHHHLKFLNAELRSGITPPAKEGYPIKVPPSLQEKAMSVLNFAYAKVPASRYGSYYVRNGDSLWTIARKHGTSLSTLRKVNNLSYRSAHKLHIGQKLLVPSRYISDNSSSSKKKSRRVASNSEKFHTVRNGENLWFIAKKYRTSIHRIKKANAMKRSTIYPGQRLVIPQA
jgi:membrane-bound lytic murein transglycosylase D